jgi:hypothetical protein
MSDKNGWHPWLRPMKMRESWSNTPMLRSLRRSGPLAKLGFCLMLLLVAVLLTACAGISTPSSEPARNPSMPQPSQSQPSVPYSQTALDVIKSWRKSLTDTLATH